MHRQAWPYLSGYPEGCVSLLYLPVVSVYSPVYSTTKPVSFLVLHPSYTVHVHFLRYILDKPGRCCVLTRPDCRQVVPCAPDPHRPSLHPSPSLSTEPGRPARDRCCEALQGEREGCTAREPRVDGEVRVRIDRPACAARGRRR